MTEIVHSDEEKYANESFENDTDNIPDPSESESDSNNESVPSKVSSTTLYAYARKCYTGHDSNLTRKHYNPYDSSSEDDNDVIVSETIAEINTEPMSMEDAESLDGEANLEEITNSTITTKKSNAIRRNSIIKERLRAHLESKQKPAVPRVPTVPELPEDTLEQDGRDDFEDTEYCSATNLTNNDNDNDNGNCDGNDDDDYEYVDDDEVGDEEDDIDDGNDDDNGVAVDDGDDNVNVNGGDEAVNSTVINAIEDATVEDYNHNNAVNIENVDDVNEADDVDDVDDVDDADDVEDVEDVDDVDDADDVEDIDDVEYVEYVDDVEDAEDVEDVEEVVDYVEDVDDNDDVENGEGVAHGGDDGDCVGNDDNYVDGDDYIDANDDDDDDDDDDAGENENAANEEADTFDEHGEMEICARVDQCHCSEKHVSSKVLSRNDNIFRSSHSMQHGIDCEQKILQFAREPPLSHKYLMKALPANEYSRGFGYYFPDSDNENDNDPDGDDDDDGVQTLTELETDLEYHPKVEVRFSSRTPTSFNTEDYAFHLNFVKSNTSNMSSSKLRFPSQRKSWSFTNDRMREIERHNQILLRKILSQKPTITLNSGRTKKKFGPPPASRMTSAAINRRKQQRQIDIDNQGLKRRIEAISLRRPLRKQKNY